MPRDAWTELIPPLTAEETARVECGLAEALARIQPELRQNHTWLRDVDLADWMAVRSWSVEELRRATLALHARSGGTQLGKVLRKLAAMPLSWTRDDLVWALQRAAEVTSETQAMAHLEVPVAIAGRLDRPLLVGLEPVLQALLEHVRQDHFVSADSRRWVSGLVGQALDMLSGSRVPAALLHSGDTFGPRVRAELADMLTGTGVGDLLLHCSTLDKPAPAAKWLKTFGRLLEAAPTGRPVAEAILQLFAEHSRAVHDDTDQLLRGLVWTVAGDDTDQTTELLAAVLRAAGSAPERAKGYPHAPRTAIATVVALSTREGDLPIATFARMTLAVKNKALLTRLHQALEQAGALRGWSAGEAMELVVHDHGLDPEGRLRTTVGAYEAEVIVSADRAGLAFQRDGRPLKSAPAAIKDDTAGLRALITEINKTLAQERQRVESVLSEQREWSYHDWAARYLEHPITARLGRELLWTSTVDRPGRGALRRLLASGQFRGSPAIGRSAPRRPGPAVAPHQNRRPSDPHRQVRRGARSDTHIQDSSRLGQHSHGAQRRLPVHSRRPWQGPHRASAVRRGHGAVTDPVQGFPARRRPKDHRRDDPAPAPLTAKLAGSTIKASTYLLALFGAVNTAPGAWLAVKLLPGVGPRALPWLCILMARTILSSSEHSIDQPL